MSEKAASPKTAKPRRFPWWARISLGVVVVLLLLVPGARWWAGSGFGRDFVEHQIESRVIQGQSVRVEGLEGDLLDTFFIDSIHLSDSDGEWGVLKDVELAWRPMSVLGRHLNIDLVSIAEISIERRPLLKTNDDSPSGGDSPIHRITLEELDIDRLAISEGVTPQAVSAAIHGSLRWTPDAGDIDVSVLPEAEGGDRLLGALAWARNDPLDGHLELDAPAGGLFATLARLEADQALAVTFDAIGNTDAFSAELVAEISGNDWIEFNVTEDDGLQAFEGHIELTPHPLTQSLTSRLGTDVEIAGEFALVDPLETLSVLISTVNANLSVEDIRSGDGVTNATVSLMSDRPDRIIQSDQVTMDGLRFDGDLSASNGVYSIDGTLLAEGPGSEYGAARSVAGPLAVRYEAGMVEVETGLRAERVSANLGETPTRLEWASVDGSILYNLETSAIGIEALSLRTPQSRIFAVGNTRISEGLPTELNGTVALRPAEFGIYERGRIEGSWRINRRSGDVSAVSAQLRGTGLLAAEDTLQDWLGDAVTLRLTGEVNDSGAVNLTDVRIGAASANATARIRRTAEGYLTLNGSVSTKENYPLQSTLPSAVIDVRAEGMPDALEFTSRLTADEVSTGGQVLRTPVLEVEGRLVGAALSAHADLSGVHEDEAVHFQSDLSFSEGIWNADNLAASWQELNVTGEASGQGGDVETFTGALNIVGDLPEGMPASSVDLTVTRQIGDLRATGRLGGVSAGPLMGSAIALDVSGDAETASYDIRIDGDMQVSDVIYPLSIQVTGEATDILSGARRTTGNLSLDWGGHQIATTSPYHVAQSEKGVTGDLALSLFGGTLVLSLSDDAQNRINLHVSEIQLPDAMQALQRSPIEGTASLLMHIREQGEHLVGDLSGEFASLYVPDAGMSPISVHFDGELQDEALSFRVNTLEGQSLNAVVTGLQPVSTRVVPLSISPDNERMGHLSARFDGRVENILALVLPDGLRIEGDIDAELSAELPFEPASASGDVTFRDGVFEHASLGAVFQNINFDVGLENQVLSLNQFSANGRRGGTLNGSGTMGLTSQSESSLRLVASQLVVVDRREGRFVASGEIGAEVEEEQIVVSGDLTLDEGHIYIDRLPGSGVTTLDVVFTDDPVGEEVPEESRRVVLDIALNAPRRLDISGQGVDAELALASKITGTTDDIQINGRAEIVRGRFELLGKRFTFTESDVMINGDPMLARLNITAERQTDDILARVQITGTPENPDISLTAEPNLPDDEVLSRVLFGRSPSQLTGLEAARLAAALATFGGGGGFDLIGGIEQIAGLDTLDVSQNSSGQFMVTTGRYISDNVYLEVSSSANGSPGLSVEWEPRDNIAVGAETMPGQGQSFSIQWKRDFD